VYTEFSIHQKYEGRYENLKHCPHLSLVSPQIYQTGGAGMALPNKEVRFVLHGVNELLGKKFEVDIDANSTFEEIHSSAVSQLDLPTDSKIGVHSMWSEDALSFRGLEGEASSAPSSPTQNCTRQDTQLKPSRNTSIFLLPSKIMSGLKSFLLTDGLDSPAFAKATESSESSRIEVVKVLQSRFLDKLMRLLYTFCC